MKFDAYCGLAAIIVQRPNIEFFQASVSEQAAIAAGNIANKSCLLNFTRICQQGVGKVPFPRLYLTEQQPSGFIRRARRPHGARLAGQLSRRVTRNDGWHALSLYEGRGRAGRAPSCRLKNLFLRRSGRDHERRERRENRRTKKKAEKSGAER